MRQSINCWPFSKEIPFLFPDMVCEELWKLCEAVLGRFVARASVCIWRLSKYLLLFIITSMSSLTTSHETNVREGMSKTHFRANGSSTAPASINIVTLHKPHVKRKCKQTLLKHGFKRNQVFFLRAVVCTSFSSIRIMWQHVPTLLFPGHQQRDTLHKIS